MNDHGLLLAASKVTPVNDIIQLVKVSLKKTNSQIVYQMWVGGSFKYTFLFIWGFIHIKSAYMFKNLWIKRNLLTQLLDHTIVEGWNLVYDHRTNMIKVEGNVRGNFAEIINHYWLK